MNRFRFAFALAAALVFGLAAQPASAGREPNGTPPDGATRAGPVCALVDNGTSLDGAERRDAPACGWSENGPSLDGSRD